MNLKQKIISFINPQFPSTTLQFIKFCLVGSTGVIVNLSVYTCCIYFLHLNYLLAATVSFLVAVSSNYFLNHYFTFTNICATPNYLSYFKFFSICSLGYGINILLLYLFVDKLGLGVLISQILAILIASLNNFIGSKLWVFIEPPKTLRR
jgi:putative flippase GtrA